MVEMDIDGALGEIESDTPHQIGLSDGEGMLEILPAGREVDLELATASIDPVIHVGVRVGSHDPGSVGTGAVTQRVLLIGNYHDAMADLRIPGLCRGLADLDVNLAISKLRY